MMFGQTTNPQDQESTFKLKLGLIVSVIKITLYSLNGEKTEPSFVFVGQINLKLNLYNTLIIMISDLKFSFV